MGKIYLSCGHEDLRKPLGWVAYTEEWCCDAIEGYAKAINSGSYCTQCFAALVLQNPEKVWLTNWEAEEAVFGQKE